MRTPGLLGHGETVALMRSADLLFLPMHELPPGRRAGLVPYKTYEYLAAERPILAAVPDGDVRDLLAPLEQASVCRPSDVGAMAADIRERATGTRVVAVSDRLSPVVRELERRRLVARIAPVFDEVIRNPMAVRSGYRARARLAVALGLLVVTVVALLLARDDEQRQAAGQRVRRPTEAARRRRGSAQGIAPRAPGRDGRPLAHA